MKTLERASSILASARAQETVPEFESIQSPESRLSAELDDVLGARPLPSDVGATAVVLVGDLDEGAVLDQLEEVMGEVHTASMPEGPPLTLKERSRRVELDSPVAQAQLGYVVAAPPPSAPESWAWRLVLYVLTHGYEGRLGKEAISRQGLVYYIDSAYDSDGRQARIALRIGVDPGKLQPMRALLVQSLEDLRDNPPTEQELDEAKQHLVGRRRSAAQSNEEISASLLHDWIGAGRLVSTEEFAHAVSGVSREEVLAIIPKFIDGGIVEVRGDSGTHSGGEPIYSGCD